MKKSTSLFFISLFMFLSFNVFSQNFNNKDVKEQVITEQINPILKGKYRYCLECCDVISEFIDTIYIEYYPNNEFIKCNINWLSNSEYELTIIEIKKKTLPFKIGTKMKTKLKKLNNDMFDYTTNLKGQSWSGTFLKIN